jgi:IPT/TIG domain/PKD domain
MHILRRSWLAFAVVVVASAVGAQPEPPEYPVGENGCAGARVIEHLERHGDFGRIDPEALLYVTRVEHERRQLDRRQGINAEAIAGNVWTSIGPTNGAGRAIAIAHHPGLPSTAIIGAAGGGAWKTTNNGVNWTSLTETLPNLSVGAVAYAPSEASRVYLGTGEGGYAQDFIPGIGLLWSDDGGATWNLPATVLAPMFYRIVVHPTNPNDIIVGTNRGALRSVAGPNGPWTTVIASSPGLGEGYGDVTDIVRDPSNASVLYAATWDRNRWCQRFPCSQILAPPTVLKSTNGGATWTPAGNGLPLSTHDFRVERMSIAIAPSSPNTLYALTALFQGESGQTLSHVYKTTDGGASWTETGLVNSEDGRVNNLLGVQGWYDNTIVVAPGDPNTVVAAGVQYARTTDGGATWSYPFSFGAPHVDVHDLRYDAAGLLWIANDGGIWTSSDHASTATNRTAGLVTRQYYAIAIDGVNRNRVLGGTQDNGTNLRTDGGGTAWSFFSGGDGFQCFIHPEVPSVAFSTFQFADLLRTKGASSSAPIVAPSGPVFAATEKKPFFSVLKADPTHPSTLYLGTTRLWKSTTAGESWIPLSMNTTGGAWGEDTIRAIAVAPSDAATILIARAGRILRTTDGGATWSFVTLGLPGRTVTSLAISPENRNLAYATIAGTSGNSLYYTTDGTNWSPRSSGLPSFSAQVVRFDPTDVSTLYAGTDVGVYRTTDGGATWSPFGTGMPAVSVYDIQILPDGSVFRAATHGRGIWELNVTGIENHPPTVLVTAPTAAVTVARGAEVAFSGAASDVDGEPLTMQWTFADDWSTKVGATTVSHRFDRAGTWPVALTAKDVHGAVSGAEAIVTVLEPSNNCATPLVVPAAGPFPWSVTLNSEVASRQTSLDPSSGGSCYPFLPLRTMWLSFTPTVTDDYAFSLCASGVPGFISAFDGPNCTPTTALPMCVANTLLSGDCGTDPSSSMVLTAGVTYRFVVSSYYTDWHGPITVTISRGFSVAGALRSVSPATSPVGGGAKVVLTGAGFAEGAIVRFDGIPASGVTVLSPNLITATVPAHGPGNVDVSVDSDGTKVTAAGAFTYTQPPPASDRRRAARH